MSRAYASGTTVTKERSHFELQRLMRKYGCSDSGYMEQADRTHLMFAKDGATYRFSFDLATDERTVQVDSNYRPGKHGTKLDYERMRKMRALVAVVKAQLIAVDEGITTFEQMFVGSVVTDNGQTVAERWAPELSKAAIEGRIPSSLPLPGGSR